MNGVPLDHTSVRQPTTTHTTPKQQQPRNTVRFDERYTNTLSLAQRVPPPPEQTTIHMGDIPNLIPRAMTVWQALDRQPLSTHNLPMPAKAAQMWAPYHPPDDNSTWFIYTDGSYDHNDPSTAAWALVTITADEHHITAYQGHHAARLTSSTTLEPGDITSSTTTELAGLLWAILTAIGIPTTRPVIIYTDSMAAMRKLYTATGTTSDDRLARLCNYLLRHRPLLQVQHIHGHDQHPWNTTADFLANMARTKNTNTTTDTVPLHMLQHTLAMDWEWLSTTDSGTQLAYPPTTSTQRRQRQSLHTDIDVRHHQAKQHYDPIDKTDAHRDHDKPTTPQQVLTTISLNLVTYNTEALNSQGHTAHHHGRDGYYKHQFHQMGAHIVAIQEGRRKEGTHSMCGYHSICAGTNLQGRGGVELWFSTQLPYAQKDTQSFCFQAHHFHILHQDHRRLFVRIAAPHMHLNVACCHALDHSRDAHERADWWRTTCLLTSRWTPQFVMIDANGRLGDINDERVQNLGFQQNQDSNGDELHHLADHYHYCVTNTCHHDQHGWTWTHRRSGKRHRIDYILCRTTFTDSVTESMTRHDFDDDKPHTDHMPVMTKLSWSTRQTAQQTKRFSFDKRKLGDPNSQAHFAHLLRQEPKPDWYTDLNDHATTITDSLLRAATTAFQRDNTLPQKSYISQDTLTLIRCRRDVSRLLKLLPHTGDSWTHTHQHNAEAGQHHIAQWDLPDTDKHHFTHYLRVLANELPLSPMAPQAYDDWLQCLIDFHRLTRSILTRAVRADKETFLAHMADQVKEARNTRRTRHEWDSLGILLRFGGRQRKIPHVHALRRSKNGEVLTTTTDAAEDMLTTFAKNEVAQVVTPQHVLDDYTTTHTTMPPHQPRRLENIMTKAQLRQQIDRAQRNKASGHDLITNDLLQAAPAETTDHLHPLLCKMQWQVREPMMHKGVQAAHIWKGKGMMCYSESYRSISLCSIVVKHHHSFLRSRLRDLITAITLANQVGGVRGRGTDMATHVVRSRIDLTRQRGTSCITIFLDLVAAFYRAIRHLALPIPSDTDELHRIIDGLEVPLPLQPALLALMSGQATLDHHLQNKHLLHQVTEAFTNTWFDVRHSEHKALASTGSRPGDNLATDLFNIIFSTVITKIEEEMRRAGMGWQDDTTTGHFSTPQQDDLDATTSFVDDTVAQTEATNDCVLPRTKQLIDIINHIVLQHGMLLNYSPGKTAVLFSNHGAATRSATKRIWQLTSKGINIKGTDQLLKPVAQYKHLGGQIRSNGSIQPELRLRTYQARSATAPLRKAVFKHDNLPQAQKIQYAEAYACSKLFYNSQTWSNWTDQARRQIQTAYADIYRAVLRCPRAPHCHTTDDDILYRTNRPSVDDKLVYHRLLFLGRLLRSASHTTRVLLDQMVRAETSWATAITADQQWLQYHQDTDSPPYRENGISGYIRRPHMRHTGRLFANAPWRSLLPWNRSDGQCASGEDISMPFAPNVVMTNLHHQLQHATAYATTVVRSPERLVV